MYETKPLNLLFKESNVFSVAGLHSHAARVPARASASRIYHLPVHAVYALVGPLPHFKAYTSHSQESLARTNPLQRAAGNERE